MATLSVDASGACFNARLWNWLQEYVLDDEELRPSKDLNFQHPNHENRKFCHPQVVPQFGEYWVHIQISSVFLDYPSKFPSALLLPWPENQLQPYPATSLNLFFQDSDLGTTIGEFVEGLLSQDKWPSWPPCLGWFQVSKVYLLGSSCFIKQEVSPFLQVIRKKSVDFSSRPLLHDSQRQVFEWNPVATVFIPCHEPQPLDLFVTFRGNWRRSKMGNMVGTQCPPWGGQMASAVRDAYEELEADHDIQLTPETWRQRMLESSWCSRSEVGTKQYLLPYIYMYNYVYSYCLPLQLHVRLQQGSDSSR